MSEGPDDRRMRAGALAVAALACFVSLEPACRSAVAAGFVDALGDIPVGFGRETKGCTDRSCICTVTILDDAPASVPGSLRSCAETQLPKWIVFAARGAFRLNRPLPVASDKIIDGRKQRRDDGPVTIVGASRISLLIDDVRNVVLTDLFFRSDQSPLSPDAERCRNPQLPRDTLRCGVPIEIRGAARHIWINHNEFERCGDKCIAVWTGSERGMTSTVRVSGGDLITISNNVFRDSYFGVLVGAGARIPVANLPAHMRVTLYRNIFYNVFRRSPRAASHAKVHAFNNVMKYWGRATGSCNGRDVGWAASSVGEAQLLLENNILIARPNPDNCKVGVQIGDYSPEGDDRRGMGMVRAVGNSLANGATVEEHQSARVFNPNERAQQDFAYPYVLSPTAGLEQILNASAGPRGFAKRALAD